MKGKKRKRLNVEGKKNSKELFLTWYWNMLEYSTQNILAIIGGGNRDFSSVQLFFALFTVHCQTYNYAVQHGSYTLIEN